MKAWTHNKAIFFIDLSKAFQLKFELNLSFINVIVLVIFIYKEYKVALISKQNTIK